MIEIIEWWGWFGSGGNSTTPARARRTGRQRCPVALDMRGFDGGPASGQTVVQTVKAPDIAGCWQARL